MSFESEPIVEEKQSDLDKYLIETVKKFDQVTFNQEKSSFILQNLSIILTIKVLEDRNIFRNRMANEWNNADNLSNEEQFVKFYENATAFVKNYIDPFYETNDLSSYLASNEDNFAMINSIMRSFVDDFPNDALKDEESILEILENIYWIHLKPKRDYSTLNVSPETLKFLLLNSLQKDLDTMYDLLLHWKESSDSTSKDQFIEKLLHYRVLDPITLTGSVLSQCFTIFSDFYVKIVAELQGDSEILERLFGTIDVSARGSIQNVIALRHLYGLVPDKDLVLLSRLNLFIAMNNESDLQKPVKTNLHFNIIKGNILLSFNDDKAQNELQTIQEAEQHQELQQEINQLTKIHKNFILSLDSANELKTTLDKVLDVARQAYLSQFTELKIKSDIQEKLAIVNPLVDFLFLQNEKNNYFSLITGFVPNKIRLNITMTKVILNQYYEHPEDTINVIDLFLRNILSLLTNDTVLALYMNRNVLYHSEYANFRKHILETAPLRLVIDFGDYRYQRTKNGLALVITKEATDLSNNIFKGLNLLSLEQEKKEQLLREYGEDFTPEENVISRDIPQQEFLGIQGYRFFIKKPSKWFDKFSVVPNTLGEYIESIDTSVKVGENKVLYISDQKVKELQLEASMLKYALKGKHFNKFVIPENHNLIILPPDLPEEQIESEYPNIWKYLLENKELLESRSQVKKNTIKWYQIADAERVTEKFIKPPKLLLREKANQPVAIFDTKGTLQMNSALALRFTKQIRFRDYFKVLAWINSLVVKAGYQDLTQDSKSDARLSIESLGSVTIPLELLRDDVIASNVQQINQMCLANKFSFDPHLLMIEYPEEGKLHPEVYDFLFEKIYAVLKKKMKNLLDTTIKISEIAIIEVNKPNSKKKVDEKYLYPIFQDYKRSLLVLQDGELEITIKLKPRQAYTLPFLQLFLAYQPKEMILNYLKQYTKPEPLDEIIGNWPIPELQMKHVMETYNFVRFQRQNFVNFFNRTRNMLIKVETMVAKHYGYTPEEIEELLHDTALIES